MHTCKLFQIVVPAEMTATQSGARICLWRNIVELGHKQQ